MDSVGEWKSPEDDFLLLIFNKRFGENETCYKCGKPFSYQRVSTRKSFHCTKCTNQIYPLKGTIFEKARVNLLWWVVFIRMMLFDKKTKITDLWNWTYMGDGVSIDYEVSYQTVHRIFHLIKKNIVNDELVFVKKLKLKIIPPPK